MGFTYDCPPCNLYNKTVRAVNVSPRPACPPGCTCSLPACPPGCSCKQVVYTAPAALPSRLVTVTSHHTTTRTNNLHHNIANIPVTHTGYRPDLHSKTYSLTREEVARDLPPTQVKIHHVPKHHEYSHCYDHSDAISEEDKASAKQVGYRAEMHNKAYSATAEEVARDLPPTQVKIHHVPKHLEYTHEYANARQITEEDKATARQVGYQAHMHNKAYSATAEEVARDLPPTQVKIHHVPQHLVYEHQYNQATLITEADKAAAKQVGYRSEMHNKAYSASAEEVARDLPPTQVKIHHVPQHLEYSHCYDHNDHISAQDVAAAKQVGYRADLHNVAYSASAEQVARDLPPTQVRVHHVPHHHEVAHCYDHVRGFGGPCSNCPDCRKC